MIHLQPPKISISNNNAMTAPVSSQFLLFRSSTDFKEIERKEAVRLMKDSGMKYRDVKMIEKYSAIDDDNDKYLRQGVYPRQNSNSYIFFLEHIKVSIALSWATDY